MPEQLRRVGAGAVARALVVPLLLVACGVNESEQPSPQSPPVAVQSLVIAPLMSGTFFCDEAVGNPSVQNEDDAARLCASKSSTAGRRIEAALAAIGPKVSASGEYKLGYTLIVPLFRYFKKFDGLWKLDTETLKANLATIGEVDRPVVVHLSSTHFTFSGMEFSRELAQDDRNLQWTRDGPAKPDDYFNVPIVAWTLADANAPVNVMRRHAMNGAIDALCGLPAALRDRIVGVSVLGETHDVFPSLAEGPTYSIPTRQLTDLSPVMAHGFRAWLRSVYPSIARLNAELGASFESFESINPPSRDIRSEVLNGYFDHMDSYAHGLVPVYGWIYDARGRDLAVRVLLDGKEVGNAGMGFSRTDATEAVPRIGNPNVGFRYDLNYREIAYGSHTVEVQVSIAGAAPLSVAKREIVYIDRNLSAWVPIPSLPNDALPMSTDPALIGGVDGPAGGQVSLFYNPLAQLWLHFRNLVVRQYIDGFATIAAKSCIPREKIFSHQISPELYGSWNSEILAVGASLQNSASYTPGTTLYGGAALGGAFLAMKKRLEWTQYAVSEMHPITNLTDAQYAAMFDMHRTGGAVFVAPYFMEVPTHLRASGDLARFNITPDNTSFGSDGYYRAIRAAMAR